LRSGHETYCITALRTLFDGKTVSHVLPYNAPGRDEDTKELFMENRKRISISGVQQKLSLIQVKNKLRLTEKGEKGTHILKPIPYDLNRVDEVPANEHLTMQIAKQVFGIHTAANGLVFFKNDEPAYITKRFDYRDQERKWGVEDFASLAGKTSENAGSDFKYNSDYVELGNLIKTYVVAWRVEIEKFFALVLFNYLFSNGDAHLKNFSLMETQAGDYILSPAYDLINTQLHVNDTAFALSGGILKKSKRSVNYDRTGLPNYSDFIMFGKECEIPQSRIEKILKPFCERQVKAQALINQSFLSDPAKRGYLMHYNRRRNTLIK
jgi:serine/threonine-protein kinase HipA